MRELDFDVVGMRVENAGEVPHIQIQSHDSLFAFYDQRPGEAGCVMTIGGDPTDRDGLLDWFGRQTSPVTVHLVIDDRRYGHVVSADFLEK